MIRAVHTRTSSKPLIVLALVAACQFASGAANAEVIVGRVVKVTDGDTITVLDASNTQHKIRLAGIDAPEKKQPFGRVSQESLAEMVAGKSVSVETDKLDRYARAIGVVMVGGVDVNREQVERGLAWWYRAYAREQSLAERIAYARAEEAARRAQRGVWSVTDAIAPWDWRQAVRQGGQLGAE